MYDASGRKLRTQIFENGLLKATTDYCGAYIYENKQLQYIQTAEGRIAYLYSTSPINTQTQTGKGTTVTTVTSRFEYFLTDHLGNTRVVFTKGATGTAETVQEDHYYPFGLQQSGAGYTNTTLLNKFLYNGKEKQDQTGMYDYGFRQMDPVLGRWFCVDRMAESYLSTSPYVYVFDNPMRFIDPDGLNPGYTSQPWVVDWYADGQDEDWDVNNGVETLLHDGPGHAITSSCNTSLPKPDDNEKPNEYKEPSWWQSFWEDMTKEEERRPRREAHDEASSPGKNFEHDPNIPNQPPIHNNLYVIGPDGKFMGKTVNDYMGETGLTIYSFFGQDVQGAGMEAQPGGVEIDISYTSKDVDNAHWVQVIWTDAPTTDKFGKNKISPYFDGNDDGDHYYGSRAIVGNTMYFYDNPYRYNKNCNWLAVLSLYEGDNCKFSLVYGFKLNEGKIAVHPIFVYH